MRRQPDPGGRVQKGGHASEGSHGDYTADELLRELADAVADVFWLTDPTHNAVYYVSPAYERMFGRSRERLYSEPSDWLEALHPEDRDRVRDDLVGRSIAEFQQEYRVVRPDGTLRWVVNRGYPVRDASGAIVRLAGTIRDVTERKKVEQALMESQRRWATLIGNLPGMVYRCRDDACWTIEYVSEAAETLLGYRPESLLDSRDVAFADLVHPEDREWLRQQVASAPSGGGFRAVYRIRTRTGETRWVEEQGCHVEDGRMLEGVILDCTALKEKELELERRNRALHLLSQSNQALIRAQDEEGLLAELCRVAVTSGGYRAAVACSAARDGVGALLARAHWRADGGAASPVSGIRVKGSELGFGVHGTEVAVEGQDHLPGVRRLAEALGLQGAYAGVCLPLVHGESPLGALVLFRERDEAVSEQERELLEELAENLAFGLHTQKVQRKEARLQETVRRIGTAVSAHSGNEFFQDLILRMTAALGADIGFVGRFAADDPNRVEAVAGVQDEAPMEPLSYDVTGTPCEACRDHPECIYAADVTVWFPSDTMLADLGAEAYIGHRLDNANGDPIGLLFLLYRRPLVETELVASVLCLVVARAAAELERLDSENRIRQLAYSDTTTRLPNRAAFMERLDQSVGAAEESGRTPVIVTLINLNRFKEVNDALGHELGDALLRQVGERLEGTLRDDEYLARFEGDEFIVTSPGEGDSKHRGDLEVLRRLWQATRTPFRVDGGPPISLECTAGTAIYPEDGACAKELVKQANIALHEAKHQQTDFLRYRPAMGRKLNRQLDLVARFRAALPDDRLVVYFQPQVDLSTGTLSGAEALVRWNDPDLGWMEPGDFLPILEQRRLMPELDQWMIGAVARQIRTWQDAGVHLPRTVSVNLSAQQLQDLELPRRLDAILGRYALDPSYLGLEITETGIMRDPALAAASLQEIRSRGVRIDVDDFGMGYSSLAYLKHFAADYLKIDRSFVAEMLTEDSDHTIVSTIVAMAGTLGMGIVAEGVESREQALALRALGCSHGQGFHFGRPQAADAFAAAWLHP